MSSEIFLRLLTPAIILGAIPSAREFIGIQKILVLSLALFYVTPIMNLQQTFFFCLSVTVPLLLVSETFSTIGRALDLARGALATEQIIPGTTIHAAIFEGIGKQIGLIFILNQKFVPNLNVTESVLEQLQSVLAASAPLMLIIIFIDLVFNSLGRANSKFQLNTELATFKILLGMFYGFFWLMQTLSL